MAETANIAKMAERLSKELFDVFGWQQTGPMNSNWACNNKDHGVKTHPADAVWYYDEPYSNQRTYILADLKSYQKTTIKPKNIQEAIVNLSMAMACTESSNDWKSRFIVDSTRPSQIGRAHV